MSDGVARLQVLASAIAGRSIDVADADPGARSWTDGTTIFLEPATSSEQVQLLAVQASLVAAGSLDPDVLSALGRNRDLARRYLAVEAQRALTVNVDVLPPTARAVIDHGVAVGIASPGESLQRARADPSLEAAWLLGAIEPRRIRSWETVTTEADAVSSPRAKATEADALELLDEDPDGFDVGSLLTSPVGGGGPIGRLLARLLRPSRGRGKGGPPGADAPTHFSGTKPGSGRTVSAHATPGERTPTPTSLSTTRRYPEWDHRARAYRPEWCIVVERVAEPGSDVLAVPDTRALRRTLAPLGLGLTPCRRQKQGDDIDLDAVVEATVDLVAGVPHDDDLYIESLRRRRDLAALVLLDVSGSAGEPAAGGRTVHDHQREAAAMLTGALHELGDRVALLAFNSRGRTAVQVATLKSFDDDFDAAAVRRLAGTTPAAYTRVGAAVRHGTALLEAGAGTPRRLLVVLSDGFAYDHGYEGRHGEADARRALLEARRQGVGCLCVSVGADVGGPALRRVFGTAAHAAVPSAGRLPAVVGPLFAAALASAEAQRRRFQRTDRTRHRLQLDRETSA